MKLPRALRHAHSKQDEIVFVLSETLVLHTDEGETELTSGMGAGFKAGTGNAHRLLNQSAEHAVYLQAADRTTGNAVTYPDEDLVAKRQRASWVFMHEDGTPYR